ncbi:MAG: C4-dicarboxylate ABC transporter [Planctomycetota bacterium]|nr:MAG: C4-dicarboxylate ABC transporter [Planctomycetota bacterium]
MHRPRNVVLVPWLLATVLGLGLGAAPPVPAAEFTLKIATVAPDRTPWAELLARYEKEVEKSSGGRLEVRVYLGGIKGDEQSIVRQVFRGDSLQMGGVSTAAMATVVPDVDILELPYLFDSPEEADRILDGPARPILERMLEAKGMKLLMYSENGYRSFGTRFGFVRRPADLKARKMRSQESEVHVETYRALGASPIGIAVSEVLSALETGVVEGFDNTPLFTFASGWYQAISYYTVSEHIYQPALLVVNKAWWDALPPELQQVLLAPAARLQQKGREAVRALQPALLENFEAVEVKVYRLTEQEKEAFRAATRPVWDRRRASAGPDGKALLDAILKAKQQAPAGAPGGSSG